MLRRSALIIALVALPALAERPRVVVVKSAALNAYARTADRTQALRAGFQMHIPKPVDIDELAEAIVGLAGKK